MQCQCVDDTCPVHRHRDHCENTAFIILYEAEGDIGISLCAKCADEELSLGDFVME